MQIVECMLSLREYFISSPSWLLFLKHIYVVVNAQQVSVFDGPHACENYYITYAITPTAAAPPHLLHKIHVSSTHYHHCFENILAYSQLISLACSIMMDWNDLKVEKFPARFLASNAWVVLAARGFPVIGCADLGGCDFFASSVDDPDIVAASNKVKLNHNCNLF